MSKIEQLTAKSAVAISDLRPKKVRKVPLLARHFPLTILLAEDNKVSMQVAVHTLRRLGYQPDMVTNGREAVETVLGQQYDLVLMDVHMPEMGGLEASRLICRHLAEFERPVIVALTAGTSDIERSEYFDAGMDRFLIKPFDLNALITLLVEEGQHLLNSEESW